MAGTDARFNATLVRNGLKFAMRMAFPEDGQRQITWMWTTKRDFSRTDSGGYPLDWSQSNVQEETIVNPMIVDCAVKFVPAGGTNRVGGTTLGIMDVANVVVTMLDVDHDALLTHGTGKFPDMIQIDEARYYVQYTAPPYALFDMTVWDIYAQTVDVSISEG